MKSYSAIWIHLIWTTKERRPLLDSSFRGSLIAYLKKQAGNKGILLDSTGGIEDHLHALVRLLPDQRLSWIVQQLKGSSSRWINRYEFYSYPFAWQSGYGALSVNPKDIGKVRKYILNQEQHHREWRLDQELQRFNRYNS